MYAFVAQRCEGEKFIVIELAVKDIEIARPYLFGQHAARLSTLKHIIFRNVYGQLHVIEFPNFYLIGAVTNKAIYDRPLYEQRNIFLYLIIEC
ncbi:hypothetical protein EJ576_26040 [Pseudomonas sp. C 49-2]|nr:hypothetical protein EJ576_26040 [Pseudomonas sp. C 49-2]